jgi:N-acetylmuramoyl-L-alanine amidase
MPAVRVEVGYLTSPTDRALLTDPHFRDRVVASIVAAVQRMYLPIDSDIITGALNVDELLRDNNNGAGRTTVSA